MQFSVVATHTLLDLRIQRFRDSLQKELGKVLQNAVNQTVYPNVLKRLVQNRVTTASEKQMDILTAKIQQVRKSPGGEVDQIKEMQRILDEERLAEDRAWYDKHSNLGVMEERDAERMLTQEQPASEVTKEIESSLSKIETPPTENWTQLVEQSIRVTTPQSTEDGANVGVGDISQMVMGTKVFSSGRVIWFTNTYGIGPSRSFPGDPEAWNAYRILEYGTASKSTAPIKGASEYYSSFKMGMWGALKVAGPGEEKSFKLLLQQLAIKDLGDLLILHHGRRGRHFFHTAEGGVYPEDYVVKEYVKTGIKELIKKSGLGVK